MLVENCGVELRYLVLAILVLDLALNALRCPELVFLHNHIHFILTIDCVSVPPVQSFTHLRKDFQKLKLAFCIISKIKMQTSMTLASIKNETDSRIMEKMASPHRQGTNGQFNDEYDINAFQKMRKKHFVPRKINCDAWHSTPNVDNLPASCDDEMYEDHIFTSVDYSMVQNASENALIAMVKSVTYDEPMEEYLITEENCVRVSFNTRYPFDLN